MTKTSTTEPSSLEATWDYYYRLLAPDAPPYVTQHKFHPTRKFRFDVAWPEHRIYVELHGGTWTSGRHTRGSGFERDREKMNLATVLGWRGLEITTTMLTNDPELCVKQALTLLAVPVPHQVPLVPVQGPVLPVQVPVPRAAKSSRRSSSRPSSRS